MGGGRRLPGSGSVNPTDWDPLRLGVDLLHRRLQNGNGLLDVIVHYHHVKEVAVALAQTLRVPDQPLQTSIILKSRTKGIIPGQGSTRVVMNGRGSTYVSYGANGRSCNEYDEWSKFSSP